MTSTRSAATRGPVQHVLRSRVGARHGGQFLVAPVAANGVRLPGGSHRELRESAVAFAAEGPALERPVVDGRAQHVAYEDSFADAIVRNSRAHIDDAAADVRTLDARELKGVPDHVASTSSTASNPAAPPSPVPEVIAFEYHPIRVFTSVLLIPAAATWMSTSPLLGRGTGTSVRYSSRSSPPWPVRRTAAIVVGNKIDLPPLGGDAGAYHCCVTRRAGRTTAGSSIRAEPIRTLDGNQRRSTPFADETAISPTSGLPPRRSGPAARCGRPLRSAPDTVDDDLDQSVVERGLDLVTLVPSGRVIDRRNSP